MFQVYINALAKRAQRPDYPAATSHKQKRPRRAA